MAFGFWSLGLKAFSGCGWGERGGGGKLLSEVEGLGFRV